MKRFSIAAFLPAMLAVSVPAQAQDMFTGDTKLACEAVLCLSTGQRPDQCSPSIQKYFSISMKKFSETLKARKNFLNLCPASTQDEKMKSLVDAITNGASRCDVASLNSTLIVYTGNGGDSGNYGYYVGNQLPSYCSAYNGDAYTDLKPPVYVGAPERGGFWVELDKYDAALRDYNTRIAAKDAAAGQNNNNGGR
jgi:TrbM